MKSRNAKCDCLRTLLFRVEDGSAVEPRSGPAGPEFIESSFLIDFVSLCTRSFKVAYSPPALLCASPLPLLVTLHRIPAFLRCFATYSHCEFAQCQISIFPVSAILSFDDVITDAYDDRRTGRDRFITKSDPGFEGNFDSSNYWRAHSRQRDVGLRRFRHHHLPTSHHRSLDWNGRLRFLPSQSFQSNSSRTKIISPSLSSLAYRFDLPSTTRGSTPSNVVSTPRSAHRTNLSS